MYKVTAILLGVFIPIFFLRMWYLLGTTAVNVPPPPPPPRFDSTSSIHYEWTIILEHYFCFEKLNGLCYCPMVQFTGQRQHHIKSYWKKQAARKVKSPDPESNEDLLHNNCLWDQSTVSKGTPCAIGCPYTESFVGKVMLNLTCLHFELVLEHYCLVGETQ